MTVNYYALVSINTTYFLVMTAGRLIHYNQNARLSASWGRAPPAAMRAGHRRTMRFLNNLKLIFKLAIPTAIFVAITIGLVAIAKNGLDSLSADTKELADVETRRLTTLLKINAEVNEATTQEKNLILVSAEQPDRLKSGEGTYQ